MRTRGETGWIDHESVVRALADGRWETGKRSVMGMSVCGQVGTSAACERRSGLGEVLADQAGMGLTLDAGQRMALDDAAAGVRSHEGVMFENAELKH